MGSSADTSYKNIGGRLTKFSSIPEPPADLSPSAKKFLTAIKETVEVREGKRGNSLDRSIIVRDLLDPAFTAKYWPDGGASNPNQVTASQRDTIPPGIVTGLALDQEGADFNVLSWNNPVDSDLSGIEIYAASTVGIPMWGSDMECTLNDLFRHTDGYVYRFIKTGPITGRGPTDPIYGIGGTDPHWQRMSYPYKTINNAYPKAFLSAKPGEEASWTHSLSGEALAHDWYYWVRAMDTVGNKSEWVPAGTAEGLLAYAKTIGMVVPDPTGLCICETGSTNEFNNLDINLCWNPSTFPSYVKEYDIEILDSVTVPMTRRRIEEGIISNRWTYAYGMNKADSTGCSSENSDGANDRLTIRLWAVDLYGRRSEGYDQISVTNPAPSNVGTITKQSWFRSVRFMWTPNPEPDIDHYSYMVYVGDGNPATGAAYTSWQGAWGSAYNQQTEIAVIEHAITDAQIDATYNYGGPYVYVQVKAVDTWGSSSASGTFAYGFPGRPVEPKEITDFAINASKMFLRIPVLEGDVWYANTPAGYVRWLQHKLYYNGKCYSIPASQTNKKYIYWIKPSSPSGSGTPDDPYISGYSSQDAHPADAGILGDDGFIIAVNNDGVYDLAWNAIANQVIGSAYIMDAAITNAKIDTLEANKITAGILQSRLWDAGGGGAYFNIDSGDFKIGQSAANPALTWNNTAKTLTLKGTIFQSLSGGTFPVPIYRGEYASGTQYYKGDMVTYDKSSWICVVTGPITGKTPSSSSVYWDCYASAGDPGVAGADGATGPGVNYRGEWLPSTTYIAAASPGVQAIIRDVVKYKGSFYICKLLHTSTSATWIDDNVAGDASIAVSSSQTFAPSGGGAVQCSQVRIYVRSSGSSRIKIELYYDSAWHTALHDSVIATNTWVTVANDGTKDVSNARVSNLDTSSACIVAYFQFGDVDASLTPLSLTAYWESFGATFSSVATDLVLANDITVLRALVLGAQDSNKGIIRAGKTAFSDDTNKGLWLGYDADGTAKFKVGGPTHSIDWNGNTFTVNGTLVTTGNIVSGAVTSMDIKSGQAITAPPWSYVTGDADGYRYILYGAAMLSLAAAGDLRVALMATVTGSLSAGAGDTPKFGVRIVKGSSPYGTVLSHVYGYMSPGGTLSLTLGASVTESFDATYNYLLVVCTDSLYPANLLIPSYMIYGLAAKR